ncbi:MAG: DUF885 family protein [Luteitalea sp.]|nr:DUF885 family protein [Luteitalea sp.]
MQKAEDYKVTRQSKGSLGRAGVAEALPHFVEDYLSWRYEQEPTGATFDGVHAYDDLLEDFSRAAIDRQTRELGGFARRLAAIKTAVLNDEERVEAEALSSNLQSRVYELETVRTWERNPQLYAETLAVSLAAQAIFPYAPVSERARRVVSKLWQVPRLFDALRNNVKEPPGIFIRTAVETLRGLLQFIERDLPRAFATVDELSLLGDLADASSEATHALEATIEYLEKELAPRARASFRLGSERFLQKLRLDEGVTADANRLLAIGLREIDSVKEAFRRAAARVGRDEAAVVWEAVKRAHPPAGQMVARASEQVTALADFLRARQLVSVPEDAALEVGPTPPFYRWTFASLWAPGPFEPRPIRSSYYVTDVDPAWSPERQEEHLRDFSDATLWAISMHEAYPGHFLHFQHLRRVSPKQRRSALLAPMSFVEGWAHYGEHLMIEAGFGEQDPAIELGQLVEALVRLARLVVGVRLHTDDWSVEQGVRFFRDEALLEEGSARREAERGTFDPGYVTYALGKLMLLKLRDDCERQERNSFSLRKFHDRLLGQGTLPFPAHRRLLLGAADDGVALE